MAPTDRTVLEPIGALIELISIDTLYGDLYLRRGKELLHGTMTVESYRGLLKMNSELASFPNRIHNAMMQESWPAVTELSAQMRSTKQTLEEKAAVLALAKTLYEQEKIPVDPFSSGMQTLAGKSVKELPTLRDKALSLLGLLAKADPDCKDFYAKRHSDLQRAEEQLQDAGPAVVTGGSSPEKLRQEAREALERGNFDKLEELSKALSEKREGDSAVDMAAEARARAAATAGHLNFAFPEPVLKKAQALGMAAAKAESRLAQFAQLAPFIWHPTFADLETEQGRALRLSSLPLGADTPEALRSRVEMFVLHPFINSAGVRFLPPLIDEDVLVEDFDDPAAGAAMPGSRLLEMLGLDRRHSLTRLQIEAALTERGCRIVQEELGLDPYQFRLICIPPDLHLRIGMVRGWGNQPIWTHLDGYMLTADGKMHALAGGDVRFGGIYDMVGISRNYESDRIIARFAVVQRRRMGRRI